MRRFAPIALAVISLILVAGCNDANQKDVKGVQASANPDNIRVWANIDQHPNFTRICADGIAFLTTSRDTMPIQRVAEWDWACPKPSGFVQYKGTPTTFVPVLPRPSSSN